MLALALIVLALSIWIVLPGPNLPLFALTVGASELWPILTIVDIVALAAIVRFARGRLRALPIALAAVALGCTLVVPEAYVAYGPHVPLQAFFRAIPPRNVASPPPGAPVVVAIYGGAWQRGSPANDAALNATIASWGYRVVPIDYPHAPQARWPAQRDAVLREIDAIDARRIVLLGHSSGAQLALIAGALRSKRVSAIVTYESPVDLRLGYEYPAQPDIIHARAIIGALCDGPPVRKPACYRSASPRYAVHAGMPPVMLIAAGRDHVVNLQFERFLRDELRGDGVPVTYLELPWADHAFETVAGGFHDRIALWYLRRFLARTAGTQAGVSRDSWNAGEDARSLSRRPAPHARV
ncbi:MAG TPA: alpha/beta hydrolase [Candidatus Baltobacteraceae bacterium]